MTLTNGKFFISKMNYQIKCNNLKKKRYPLSGYRLYSANYEHLNEQFKTTKKIIRRIQLRMISKEY